MRKNVKACVKKAKKANDYIFEFGTRVNPGKVIIDNPSVLFLSIPRRETLCKLV